MKVSRLIQLLEMYDGDSDVIVMTQRIYPFENSLLGITSRDEIDSNDNDADNDMIPQNTDCSDVILVVGDQIRYGTNTAWDAVKS